MDRPRLVRRLLIFIGVLLLFTGGSAGLASALTSVVVNSVPALEAALAAAAAGTGPTDIRIKKGTYEISSVLSLEPPPGGATITLQNAGDGAVILHSASGGRILQAGFSHGTGIFVVRGLTFSGTRGGQTAINNSANMIMVADSTFLDNAVGFYMDSSKGKVEFVNNTFTQNGDAIYLDFHGSVTVTNTTVANNSRVGIHGLYPQCCSNGPDLLANSIVTGNGRDCDRPPDQRVASIDSDGTCGATRADPRLAALADNGGPVRTMALPTGSPAVGAGDITKCPQTDARGAVRGVGGKCDIGAFERALAFNVESATGAGSVQFTTTAGAFIDFHAVLPSSLPPLPGVTFPFGLFDWTIDGLTPGATFQVALALPSPVPLPLQYWKFNAGTGLWTEVCQQLPCALHPLYPNILVLTLTDGGVGDLDGVVNGMFRDPGGVGVSERPADHTPPTTLATLSPAANAAGWNNTNVTVTLTAQDEAGGSGVKEIHYAVSGAQVGGGTVGGASASLTVSGQGTTIVTYFAVDNAGNQETAKTVTVRIDKTPPTAAFGSPSPAPNAAGWNNTNVSIAFTATDTLSGVDAGRSTPSPVVLTAEGTAVTATITVVDKAGNAATFTSPAVKIDKTPPTVACVPVPRRAHGDEDGSGLFRVSASDTLSQVAGITLGGISLEQGEIIQIQSTKKPGIHPVSAADDDDRDDARFKRFKVGPGEAVIRATDFAGNVGTAVCPLSARHDDDGGDGRRSGDNEKGHHKD